MRRNPRCDARQGFRDLVTSATPPISWEIAVPSLTVAAVLCGVYVRRWSAVRRSGDRSNAPVWRLACWCSGAAMLVVALSDPLDGLRERLFVFHMTQHLLLLDAMPLLLLFGLNRVLMRPLTRRISRVERRLGPLARPWFGLLAYTAGMWVWHAPLLYDAANRYAGVHLLEHTTFISIGTLYWWHLLRPVPSRDRMTNLGPMAYMGATKVIIGLLGMALTFLPRGLYAFYDGQPAWWGLDSMTDQMMAGSLMASEQVLIMGLAFGVLFIRGLRESEKQALREERLLDLRAAEAAAAADAATMRIHR